MVLDMFNVKLVRSLERENKLLKEKLEREAEFREDAEKRIHWRERRVREYEEEMSKINKSYDEIYRAFLDSVHKISALKEALKKQDELIESYRKELKEKSGRL